MELKSYSWFSHVLEDSSFLDKAADIFIAPARYLAEVNEWLNVRVFHIDSDGTVTEKAYLKEEDILIKIMKIGLAYFAVIPSTILGCCLKGCSQLEETVKESQARLRDSGILKKKN